MACATVRVLNEPLLAALLGRDDVRAELDWLAEQHFVEQRATGLVIHDLVREVVVRDLRGEPPLEWARNCVERILRDGNAPELQPSDVVLLDKPAFAHAVTQALHHFHDEAALSRNPLLRSPMLRRYTTRRDTDSLRALLREQSAEHLVGGRRQCTLHDVLDRTCFQPAAKQQAAAAALHVSERTRRRRLREAEHQLVEALWRLETGSES